MRAVIVAVLLASAHTSPSAPANLDRLSWLQGCWTTTSGARVVEEQWTSPRGGVMLGVGRTTRDGRLVEYEFVVIRERGDTLVYEAHPSGQAPADFVAKGVEADAVVFENATHDFPQRVGYRRRGTGIDAWVEGTIGGQTRRVEFPYEAARCPGR